MDQPSGSSLPSYQTSSGSYWKFWTWRLPERNSQVAVSDSKSGAAISSETEVQASHVTEQKPNVPQAVTTFIANDLSPPISMSSPQPSSGWKEGFKKLKEIYTNHISMERDLVERVSRTSFFGGFLMGGAASYANAHQIYETNNVGRKYLSPSDAVRRRFDYAIVRFAKSGFGMGFKCAVISGTIVILTTHLTAYRQRFSSLYLPALSGAMALSLHTVGSVFSFPLGIVGTAKACGLGISSGLTLAAVVQLYALSVNKSSNDAYWLFKREYEKEMRYEDEWNRRVTELMEKDGIKWRPTAVKQLKKLDEKSFEKMDS